MVEITDVVVARLKALPKRIENPRARNTKKEKHQERNYEVTGGGERFSIFVRQSARVPDGFSCGLLWLPSGGGKVILARYNGADHPHRNTIEGDRVDFTFHVHTATERYAQAGAKTEHYATATTRFSDVNGALRALLADWNVAGLEQPAAESGLI
jgi:hypothetical protein